MRRPRRTVVDINRLESEELRTYLSRGSWNIAILTDFAGMEVYKADSDEALRSSFSVVGEFPRQIQILKSTSIIGGLSGRQKGLISRMIDDAQTRDFGKFCSLVRDYVDGDQRFKADIESKRQLAREHLAGMAEEMANLAVDYSAMQRNFTEAEVRQVRLDKGAPLAVRKKLFRLSAKMAGDFFELHPHSRKWPADREWPNKFLFRFALLTHLHFFEWVRGGSPLNLSADKIRNDIVDLNFATYGTFFDGLMTNDRKQRRLYIEAKTVLEEFIIPISRATN